MVVRQWMWNQWDVKWGQGCEEEMRERYFEIFSLHKFFIFFCFIAANNMPKANSTESASTNFQDAVIVNSSNTNLNSKMVDASVENNVTKKVAIDDECDAIGDLIGHYGKWQFVMTILLSLFQVPNTFHIFSPTFQVIWSNDWSFLNAILDLNDFLKVTTRISC